MILDLYKKNGIEFIIVKADGLGDACREVYPLDDLYMLSQVLEVARDGKPGQYEFHLAYQGKDRSNRGKKWFVKKAIQYLRRGYV